MMMGGGGGMPMRPARKSHDLMYVIGFIIIAVVLVMLTMTQYPDAIPGVFGGTTTAAASTGSAGLLGGGGGLGAGGIAGIVVGVLVLLAVMGGGYRWFSGGDGYEDIGFDNAAQRVANRGYATMGLAENYADGLGSTEAMLKKRIADGEIATRIRA